MTHRRKRIRLTALSLALAVLPFLWQAAPKPIAEPAPSAQAAEKRLAAAYVYDRAGLTFKDADAASLDQLYFSFALFKNGRISGAHWQSISAYKAYIAKHPHILPILSVGGWGADGFSQMAATAEGRAAFVDDALALMERHGFLGLDIDWEYPGSTAGGIASSKKDRENYTLLLRALREGLDGLTAQDGKPRRLCIAVGGDPSLTDNIDCAAVNRLVDQVNLMTYDLHAGGVASHHAALYSADSRNALSADRAVRAYAEAGISKSKMALGVAFYGHRWTAAKGLYQTATHKNTLTYAKLQTLLKENPSAVFYDEKAQAPYYYDGSVFVSYDNPRSIAAKSAYAASAGLLGLVAWQYDGGGTELLEAMR